MKVLVKVVSKEENTNEIVNLYRLVGSPASLLQKGEKHDAKYKYSSNI